MVAKRTQQHLVKFSEVFNLSEWGSGDGFKIFFGSLKIDNFPKMEDEIQDLKSMTLERYRQKLKFKHIDLMHVDVTLTIRPRPIYHQSMGATAIRN